LTAVVGAVLATGARIEQARRCPDEINRRMRRHPILNVAQPGDPSDDATSESCSKRPVQPFSSNA